MINLHIFFSFFTKLAPDHTSATAFSIKTSILIRNALPEKFSYVPTITFAIHILIWKLDYISNRNYLKNLYDIIIKPLFNIITGIQNILAKQPCCIQTKMYRLYRKMTINGHFSIQSIHFCLDTTFLGSIIKLSYIQNHAEIWLWNKLWKNMCKNIVTYDML